VTSVMGLEEYIERLTQCRTVDEVWQFHCDQMASYGFDRLLYGFTRYRTPTSLGNPADMLILTNHAPEYIQTFLDQNHYHHAPMVRWALENDGACSWRWLQEQSQGGMMTAAERRVYEFNLRHGVTAGYSISFPEQSRRAKGAIALTAARGLSQTDIDEVWQHHGGRIAAMNNVLHLKLIHMPYARNSLTDRQREVLEWTGDGKTIQDIAQIMGLQPATVEKHLRLARETLNVETTAQAVLKASVQNQMYLVNGAPRGVRQP